MGSAFAEDLNLVFSSHAGWLTTACTINSRGYGTLSGLRDTCTHVYIPTPTYEHTHTIKIDKDLKNGAYSIYIHHLSLTNGLPLGNTVLVILYPSTL